VLTQGAVQVPVVKLLESPFITLPEPIVPLLSASIPALNPD
jgi:hypothetical protein